MTKPSQYPENITRPMRHIHHSTIVWLDSVIFNPVSCRQMSKHACIKRDSPQPKASYDIAGEHKLRPASASVQSFYSNYSLYKA